MLRKKFLMRRREAWRAAVYFQGKSSLKDTERGRSRGVREREGVTERVREEGEILVGIER